MQQYSHELKLSAVRMWFKGLGTQNHIAATLGVKSSRSIRGWIADTDLVKEALKVSEEEIELLKQNVVLAKKAQRLADKNNLQNKSFREFARIDSSVEESNKALVDVLKENKFNLQEIDREEPKVKKTLVIQLSDLHFNELISGLNGNSFDTTIASKRLRMHVQKSIMHGIASGANHCLFALTGDLINSPRRVSEITEAATSRANAIFVAVDVIQQAIREVREYFNVTVASVTGNESRFAEYVDWTDLLASDSADSVVHNMLTLLFEGDKNVSFIPMQQPLECLVSVGNSNVLLIHGNGHGFASKTGNLESAYQKLKAKYAGHGVRVDYMLCGHIHSAYVSDWFARSSGLPGNNHYSEKALGLDGRASQNCLIIDEHGNIDSIKNDLQNVSHVDGYSFTETAAKLGIQVREVDKANVIIQKVVV